MKCIKRNKVDFYYALFDHKEPILDEYGNPSGEYDLVYRKPVKCSANVSAAKGETTTRQFGEAENYDKVIVLDTDSGIDEYSLLWIDVEPKLDEEGNATVTHDYIVKKVAKSLNSFAIAISKVHVS